MCDEFPCDNCERIVREDDEMVTMVPGLEHYFCSTKCALEFTRAHLVKTSAFQLKAYGRSDI